MSRPTILSGKNALHKFLHSEKANFLQKAPVLIVSSGVPEYSSSSSHLSIDKVDIACRKLKFIAGMEMGLQTVDAHVTSAFPTVDNVASTLEVMKRTGASNVIGVGSGAAMDLTKAIMRERGSDDVSGVLIPATYGALVASTSEMPLLLDTREEALVVPSDDKTLSANECTVIAETDALATIYQKDAIYASFAIAVDARYRRRHGAQTESSAVEMQSALSVLERTNDTIQQEDSLPICLDFGRLLSFGIDPTSNSVRSSPLALAASLIPTSFPNVPILTFMASVAPGIHHIMDGESSSCTLNNTLDDAPSLASLMEHADGAQSVSTLMSHVKTNRALWNCIDVPDDVLEAILHYSLNR